MKTILALGVVLAAFAAMSVGAASAATTNSSCSMKMTGFPVYFKVTSVLPNACDIVGRSARGSVVRIYSPVVGSARCGFTLSGANLRVYSRNSVYGSVICSSLEKMLAGQGWRRIF
jgi:type 1 fimbria pilin